MLPYLLVINLCVKHPSLTYEQIHCAPRSVPDLMFCKCPCVLEWLFALKEESISLLDEGRIELREGRNVRGLFKACVSDCGPWGLIVRANMKHHNQTYERYIRFFHKQGRALFLWNNTVIISNMLVNISKDCLVRSRECIHCNIRFMV